MGILNKFAILFGFINFCFSAGFKADITRINGYNKVDSKLYYSPENQIIRYDYSNPIVMTEIIDYKNQTGKKI